MLVLMPFPHQTIWGGERLQKYSQSNMAHIGHLYSVKGTQSASNLIMNGKYKGRSFYDYFLNNKSRYHLSAYDEFPITIALVDAKADLSIQVHPDAQMADILEKKPIGKNESHYFLQAPAEGFVYNGCACKSVSEITEKVRLGKTIEAVDRLAVRPGDYIYIEAGTLHALTAGSLVYEIEETFDYTYRLYDFDRLDPDGKPRRLDVDKALCSLDVSKKSNVYRYETGEIQERNYTTKLIQNLDTYYNQSDTLECLTLIEGCGLCDEIEITTGMTILLDSGEAVKNMCLEKAVVARVHREMEAKYA